MGIDSRTQEKELFGDPGWCPGDICFYWVPAWEAIKAMKGLRHLRVSLWRYEREHSPQGLVTEDKLIELFRSAVGVEVPNFQVELFWPVDFEVEQLRDYFKGKLSCSFDVQDKAIAPVSVTDFIETIVTSNGRLPRY